MPTLVRLARTTIRMFADDHNPPHFHVWTPNGEAMVEISSLEIMRGSIDARSLHEALEWAERNREKISAEWQRLNG